MDAASLKSELEGHLKHVPDEHAPHGFHDRFDQIAAQLETAGDEEKAALEAQLVQIRDEAQAAAKCADCEPDGEAAAAGDEQAIAPGEPAPGAPVESADDADGAPAETGGLQRILVPVAIVVVILFAAYFLLWR